MMRAKITLCRECGAETDTLVQRLEATDLPEGVKVTQSGCLGPCDKPMVLAIQSPQRAGYVFAGITAEDAGDIAATVALVLSSDQGWIEDARPCGRLRHLLVARIPA